MRLIQKPRARPIRPDGSVMRRLVENEAPFDHRFSDIAEPNTGERATAAGLRGLGATATLPVRTSESLVRQRLAAKSGWQTDNVESIFFDFIGPVRNPGGASR